MEETPTDGGMGGIPTETKLMGIGGKFAKHSASSQGLSLDMLKHRKGDNDDFVVKADLMADGFRRSCFAMAGGDTSRFNSA